MTRTGEWEIGAVSGRLTDNPGELACIRIIFLPQYMRLMPFLKPDVKKIGNSSFHCLFWLTCYSPPVTSYFTWV